MSWMGVSETLLAFTRVELLLGCMAGGCILKWNYWKLINRTFHRWIGGYKPNPSWWKVSLCTYNLGTSFVRVKYCFTPVILFWFSPNNYTDHHPTPPPPINSFSVEHVLDKIPWWYSNRNILVCGNTLYW